MMTFEQIMTELKKGIYRPVYVLMGEEPYFIDVITDFIDENALTEEEKSFNHTIMYGRDTDVYKLLNAAKRFPMMAQRQVVIVKEAQNVDDIDNLQYYFEKPTPSTVLVICYKFKSIDKRSKFYKILDKSKDVAVLESKPLRDYQIPDWINGFIKEHGYTIIPAASSLLGEYLGADLSKIVNELNKLMISLPVNEKKITLEHIETNIGISKEYNIFELQNAVGEKNILKANRIIDHFARNPKNGPVVLVISTLYSYFLKILKYHYLNDKSQSAVASALKVNPYFVKDFESAARKYVAPKIIQIISILREYDLKSKGVGNSSASDGDLMKEMIFKIIH